jgi:hypothetical protein
LNAQGQASPSQGGSKSAKAMAFFHTNTLRIRDVAKYDKAT